uniref:Uncharacterized protein n=1 Tax=Oryza brachyantha TaxID=4533 RepID=J3M5E9_ORYBR
MALSCGRRRQRGRRAGDGGGGRPFHDGKGGFFERDSEGHGRDADGQHGEDVAEEGTEEKKASLKVSSELFAGDSASAEDCAKRFEIEEVRVNSDEPQDIQRGDDEQLIEEVIIFEIQRGAEAIVHSDGLPEKHQIQDLPIDWFEEETKSRYGIKSGDSFPTVLSAITSEFHDFSVKNGVERLTMDFLDERNQKEAVLLDTSSHCGIGNNHCKYSEEYFDDTEIPAPSSSEISDFIDKHETREVVLDDCGNDDTLIVLASKDGSAHDAILYDHKDNTSEQKDQNNLAGLVDSVVVLFNQQEEIQNAIVSDDSRIPEALLNIESSSIASTYCDSSDKHQNLQEVPDSLASGDNIDEVASLQSSVPENAEDKDERSNANCISEGASYGNRMPLVRRSPAPWWNLCGVIDVFAGCKD